LSRIWEALKKAERQRAAEGRAAPARDTAPPVGDRRRILRYRYTVPVLVYGSGTDMQPFHEQVETLNANKDGCLVALENLVALGQRLILINVRNQAEQECRVAHVGERAEGRAHVGIEFLHPASYFWRRQ